MPKASLVFLCAICLSLRSPQPQAQPLISSSFPQTPVMMIMVMEGMLLVHWSSAGFTSSRPSTQTQSDPLEFAMVLVLLLGCWHTIRKLCFRQNSKMDSLLIPHLLKSLKLSEHRFKIVRTLVQPAPGVLCCSNPGLLSTSGRLGCVI